MSLWKIATWTVDKASWITIAGSLCGYMWRQQKQCSVSVCAPVFVDTLHAIVGVSPLNRRRVPLDHWHLHCTADLHVNYPKSSSNSSAWYSTEHMCIHPWLRYLELLAEFAKSPQTVNKARSRNAEMQNNADVQKGCPWTVGLLALVNIQKMISFPLAGGLHPKWFFLWLQGLRNPKMNKIVFRGSFMNPDAVPSKHMACYGRLLAS